jgi:hypothetical protein
MSTNAQPSARTSGEPKARRGRRCPRLSTVEPRPPLTKREDALIFMVIALPIFLVTVLIATLVVVLGTR